MKSLLICLFLLPFLSFAQCDSTDIVKVPDVDAQFPGGVVEMKRFIQENIEYPEFEGYMCHQPVGRVYLQFIVCKDGSIHNISVGRSSKHPEVDKMGLNLINKMPNWVPGEMDDQPVSSLVRLPITINFQ